MIGILENGCRAFFHLPGLFEFLDLYRAFLPLLKTHPEYFYEGFAVGSIYGAPGDCLWGGGRVGYGDADAGDVLALMNEYGISARLTFSNSLLREEHLRDRKCNALCRLFSEKAKAPAGVIVHSELLTEYLQKNYPALYLVSSTTKVLTDFGDFQKELDRKEFRFTVPDFRLNRAFDRLSTLSPDQKAKVEFLCNECCDFDCRDRKACYEAVSRIALGEEVRHVCRAPEGKEGYRFSKAMDNPGFIGVDEILNTYLAMGFSHFKIEGRSLGSAMVLEFLLHYLVRPEYHIHVREAVYLDAMLDLF